jgi:ferric-dicitrate binding protein FerR (iron transport regulator)
MTSLHTEVLSEFCDGAVVDPDLLAAALDDPRAREALVDFARLRAAVSSSHPLPQSLVRLRPASRRPQLWSALAGAAAMLILVALTFSLVPRYWRVGERAANPPSPTRVVRYEPGVDWVAERR